MKQTFSVELIGRGPGGAWTQLPIPFNVENAFGTKARVAVRGTINGVAYRSSIMPRGNGIYYMAVNQAIRTAAGVAVGDTVKVVMEPDTAERTVTVPPDLKDALARKPKAETVFTAFSYSHRKELVDWIEQAKKPETRSGRIEKCLKLLLDRKPLKR